MKRLPAFVLLLTLAFAGSLPAGAQIFRGPNSERQAQKAARKNEKAFRKATKKQQKALAKYEKKQRKAAKKAQGHS
jgi:hypothetical protein